MLEVDLLFLAEGGEGVEEREADPLAGGDGVAVVLRREGHGVLHLEMQQGCRQGLRGRETSRTVYHTTTTPLAQQHASHDVETKMIISLVQRGWGLGGGGGGLQY